MTPTDVVVVGAGAMGANHARVIAENPRARLTHVVDLDIDRAQRLAHAFGAEATVDLAVATRAQAAIVAAATSAHHDLVESLLQADVPVLVEKPVAEDIESTRALVALARSRGVPLVCGFIERFNPAVIAARDLLDGPPVHLTTRRHSPPNERSATGLVHDLLIHDLDLALSFAGPVSSLAAKGWSPPGRSLEVVDVTMAFDSAAVGSLSADRWGQRKVRELVLSTGSMLVEVDLMRQDVTVYRHVRHELTSHPAGYRAETVIDIPFVRHAGEPLAQQLEHFLDVAEGSATAVQTLESILPAHELAADVLLQVGAAAAAPR
jgi:predicted dehydrogenase